MRPSLLLPFFGANLNIIFIYKFILIKIDSDDNTSKKAKNFFSHVPGPGPTRRCVLTRACLSRLRGFISMCHRHVRRNAEIGFSGGTCRSLTPIVVVRFFIYIARVYYVKNLSEMWTTDCTAIFCLIRLEEHRVSSEKLFVVAADEIFKIRDGKRVEREATPPKVHIPFASTASQLTWTYFHSIWFR